MEDLYRILQVRRGADQETIAAAFARLSRRYDPAFGSPFADEEKMREIAGAYAVLSDEGVRRDYDTDLKSGRADYAHPQKQPKPSVPRPAQGTHGGASADLWRRAPPSDPSPGRAAKGPDKLSDSANSALGRAGKSAGSSSTIWRRHGPPPKAAPASLLASALPNTQPLPVFTPRPAQSSLPGTEPLVDRSEEANGPASSADPAATTGPFARPSTHFDTGTASNPLLTTGAIERAVDKNRSEASARRRRPGAIAAAAAALIVAGAALAVWGSFQAFGRADDGTSTTGNEELTENASPTAPAADESPAPNEPVPPPTISSALSLPDEFAVLAEERVVAEGYALVGLTTTTDASGAYFYAALGEDDDGSGQRLFFFTGSQYLGTDWGVDVRGVETLSSSSDGQISAIYRAYSEGDEACCPSLDPIAVFFTYDGGFRSSNADPPPEIFVS